MALLRHAKSAVSVLSATELGAAYTATDGVDSEWCSFVDFIFDITAIGSITGVTLKFQWALEDTPTAADYVDVLELSSGALAAHEPTFAISSPGKIGVRVECRGTSVRASIKVSGGTGGSSSCTCKAIRIRSL
tara:strand:- start:29 stop:427 length:399 start_codon:yes stop_codon:yes gene_type:complete